MNTTMVLIAKSTDISDVCSIRIWWQQFASRQKLGRLREKCELAAALHLETAFKVKSQ